MNNSTKNLIGTKIGMLTILDRDFRNKRSYLYCKCDCGNYKWIRADSITSKKQKSCGCLSKATQLKRKDITGLKYSMLTAIEFTGRGKGENEVWLCRCDCGKEVEVLKKNIYSTSSNSCGCKSKEQKLEASKKAFEKLKETDLIDGTSISKISREKPIKSNTSGVTGVIWDSSRNKWKAQIWFKGKYYHLGRYDNKEDAIKARLAAKERLHKEFLTNINNKK